MSTSTWFALLGACILISFTPGAGAINTMNNALTIGYRRSLWGILGQQAALLVQLAIVAAGLGVVIARSPVAFDVVRYTGAAYLAYLGFRQILADSAQEDGGAAPASADESASSIVARGVWVNLLNPKAIVFLLAFIPGFVAPDRDFLVQYAVIGVTVVVVDVLVMSLFFALLGHAFARITSTPRARRRLNVLFGLLFIGVGIMLALM
ncbi:LysE family transporter [Gordonia zhaorongruii]|uniref:LysE family transporter n=1 Tax=Gordonia zhaorongruii TaxID=2597659 RepID=UPI001049E881|nr:LysE family transporter [Gordonia zhaorongruii]